MKMELTKGDLETNIKKGKKFSIADNPLAFKILSSGIYSNKIQAIIRELCTNAFDSHVMANNAKPFVVGLPDIYKPVFYVQDFGVGLSPDQVENIFTTYFESNKRDSDEVDGCLGLGSKSPLCYTDNFNVETVWEEKKYNYLVYLDENNEPSITEPVVSPAEDGEVTGVRISIAVKNDDFFSFRDVASKVLSWFKKGSFVVAGENELFLAKKEYKFKSESYGIHGKHYGYSEVVMGNVAYPFTWSEFNEHITYARIFPKDVEGQVDVDFNDDQSVLNFYDKEKSGKYFKIKKRLQAIVEMGITLWVDRGQVSMSVSREKLEYSPKTIRVITSLISSVAATMVEDVQKKIDDSSNIWEARRIIWELLSYKNGRNPFLQILNSFDKESTQFAYKGKNLYGGGISLWVPLDLKNEEEKKGMVEEDDDSGFEIDNTGSPVEKYHAKLFSAFHTKQVAKCTTAYWKEARRSSSPNKFEKVTHTKYISPEENSYYFIKDSNHAVYSKIKNWSESLEDKMHSVFYILYPFSDDPDDVACFEEWIKDNEFPNVIKLSELKTPSMAKDGRRKRVPSKVLGWANKEGHSENQNLFWEDTTVDLNDENTSGVYVEVKHYSWKMKDDSSYSSPHSLSTLLKAMGTHFNERLIGVRKTAVKKFAKSPNWIRLDEWIDKNFKYTGQELEDIGYYEAYRNHRHLIFEAVHKDFQSFKNYEFNDNSPFKEMLNVLTFLETVNSNKFSFSNYSLLNNLKHHLGITVPNKSKEIEDSIKKANDLLANYPLLVNMYSSYSEKSIKNIVEYVQLKDQKEVQSEKEKNAA